MFVFLWAVYVVWIGRLGWWVGCLLFVAVRLECSFEVLLVLDLGLLL